jgi:hypothetical protein
VQLDITKKIRRVGFFDESRVLGFLSVWQERLGCHCDSAYEMAFRQVAEQGNCAIGDGTQRGRIFPPDRACDDRSRTGEAQLPSVDLADGLITVPIAGLGSLLEWLLKWRP